MNHSFEYIKTFPSSLDEVVGQVARIILLLDEELEHYNRFVLDLVLRETLNNAVIHGNQNDTEKSIQLNLHTSDDQFVIEVEDQGQGFDWRAVIQGEANPQADHGRGFPIFHAYCNKIILSEKGNHISLKLDIDKSE